MANTDMNITPAAVRALANNDIDNFIVAATPGGIQAQEARGQQAFVNSATLPIEFNFGTREELEQMGVKFGEPIDDLFQHVELPEGWKKAATGHSMWSKLLDDKGRERAPIFYKAAFYDRKAHISVNSRFTVSSYQECDADGRLVEDNHGTHWATVVLDGGKPSRIFGVRPDRGDDEEQNARSLRLREEHERAAYAWLEENYPDHRSHTAYWDQD